MKKPETYAEGKALCLKYGVVFPAKYIEVAKALHKAYNDGSKFNPTSPNYTKHFITKALNASKISITIEN